MSAARTYWGRFKSGRMACNGDTKKLPGIQYGIYGRSVPFIFTLVFSIALGLEREKLTTKK